MPTPSALEKELARHIAKALPQVMAGIGRPPEPSPEAEPAAYDTLEFCAAHRISRSQLYKLWRAGVGPRFMRLGKSVRISKEAAAQWRAERQDATDQAA